MHCMRKLSLYGCLPNRAALVKISLATALIIQPSQMTPNQRETTLSKPDCTELVRFFRAVALALSVSVLGACASITSLLGNSASQDSQQLEPREFITAADLAQITLGMSRAQVKSRLGPPTLNETEQDDQWDYVLKRGEGAAEEFLPYSMFFKNQKLAELAPLSPEPKAPPASERLAGLPPVITAEQAALILGTDLDAAAAISDMLNAWASAWSAKDVETYLSFYASTFEYGKKSRASWEKQRRARLSGPAKITVTLSNVQIELQSEALATAKFRQNYSSNRYRDSGMKTLTLSKASGAWKIQSEEFQK